MNDTDFKPGDRVEVLRYIDYRRTEFESVTTVARITKNAIILYTGVKYRISGTARYLNGTDQEGPNTEIQSAADRDNRKRPSRIVSAESAERGRLKQIITNATRDWSWANTVPIETLREISGLFESISKPTKEEN